MTVQNDWENILSGLDEFQETILRYAFKICQKTQDTQELKFSKYVNLLKEFFEDVQSQLSDGISCRCVVLDLFGYSAKDTTLECTQTPLGLNIQVVNSVAHTVFEVRTSPSQQSIGYILNSQEP